MACELVGVTEISERLGVSRQRVDQISKTHADFPAPLAELSAGRIWSWPDVETWAVKAGRLAPKRTRKTVGHS